MIAELSSPYPCSYFGDFNLGQGVLKLCRNKVLWLHWVFPDQNDQSSPKFHTDNLCAKNDKWKKFLNNFLANKRNKWTFLLQVWIVQLNEIAIFYFENNSSVRADSECNWGYWTPNQTKTHLNCLDSAEIFSDFKFQVFPDFHYSSWNSLTFSWPGEFPW